MRTLPKRPPCLIGGRQGTQSTLRSYHWLDSTAHTHTVDGVTIGVRDRLDTLCLCYGKEPDSVWTSQPSANSQPEGI